mmetsp:Transcript_1130/g.1663  ORF Transcript_1130/g.1663 Transcript_1130/m.1663 type:complete len:338 (+) Transcript_1130:83-1096(+)
MNLILIKPEELLTVHDDQNNNNNENVVVILDSKDARTKHILGHLQKSQGSLVSIGILGGNKGKATVFPQNDGRLKLQIILDTTDNNTVLIAQRPNNNNNNNEPQMTLLLAMCFPKRLKTLWPMIASFGYVRRIIIVRGHLTDSNYCKSSALQPHVYSPLIEEGMSQGGHTRPIQVDVSTEHLLSRETLDKLFLSFEEENDDDDAGSSKKGDRIKNTAKVLLDCEGSGLVPAREVVLTNNNTSQSSILPSSCCSAIVAVGPERGWTEEEASLFKDYGFTPSTLGLNNIFRVDTAVIAGLAIISAALEESFQQKHQSSSLILSKEEITDESKKDERWID